jgi:hypothetical protein
VERDTPDPQPKLGREAPTPEPEAPTPEPEAPTSEPEAPTSEPEAPTPEPEAPISEREAPTPEPEPPPTASARLTAWIARRRDKAESNWRFIDAGLHRTRLLATVFLLHLRYTFGYLAFGFLVSAPIQFATRRDLVGDHVLKSLVLGMACVVPFVVLWPFTRIAWERMRVPEFKNLELALTRWATALALVFVLFAGGVTVVFGRRDGEIPWWVWLCDVRVAWLNLGLMFFAWLRVKFHTLLFREFYTLKAEDDLVLRVPATQLTLDLEEPDAEAPDSD